MSRFLLTAFAAALLLVPAAVGATNGQSATNGQTRVQGTVAAKFPQNKLIRVDSSKFAHIMRLTSSQARISVGQRVELRGATLRQRGHGSRVLARGVVLTSSVPKGSASTSNSSSSSSNGEGKLEVKGTLSSLSPLTVTTSGGVATSCSVPTGMTLSGFAVGDRVRMRCDLLAGIWVLRALKQEDDDPVAQPGADDDDTSDDGDTDDSDDDESEDDDSDDDDNSGPGGGDDD